MKTSDLLLSNLNITEYNYIYKGSFYLSSSNNSVKLDVEDIQNDEILKKLKNTFNLEETCKEIRDTLMDMLVEKTSISSKIIG